VEPSSYRIMSLSPLCAMHAFENSINYLLEVEGLLWHRRAKMIRRVKSTAREGAAKPQDSQFHSGLQDRQTATHHKSKFKTATIVIVIKHRRLQFRRECQHSRVMTNHLLPPPPLPQRHSAEQQPCTSHQQEQLRQPLQESKQQWEPNSC
jgi:hypothetical protein